MRHPLAVVAFVGPMPARTPLPTVETACLRRNRKVHLKKFLLRKPSGLLYVDDIDERGSEFFPPTVSRHYRK